MNNDEIVRLSYSLAVDILARAQITGQLAPESIATKVNLLAELLGNGLRKLSTQASFPAPVTALDKDNKIFLTKAPK